MNGTTALDHIGLSVADYAVSRKFYLAALKPLGWSVIMEFPSKKDANAGGFGVDGKPYLWLGQGKKKTAPHIHIAIGAESRKAVDAFYKAAIKAGGKDNGKPGIRAHYHPTYYGAFVIDPDGHNLEAVCHKPEWGETVSDQTGVRLSGGCQCGAVRYALHEPPTDPHICHCRMCQKAFGSFFAPLTGVPLTAFELTRGRLAVFKSSDQTERGFCRDCGTPLTFHYVGSPRIAIAIGSLDEPEDVEPARQYGIESRLPWFGKLAGLPGEKTTEQNSPDLAGKIRASNHQHPDRDTADWPPGGKAS